jgi:hypothetical protein
VLPLGRGLLYGLVETMCSVFWCVRWLNRLEVQALSLSLCCLSSAECGCFKVGVPLLGLLGLCGLHPHNLARLHNQCWLVE